MLVLKKGKARLFYSGSPVIYGGAVEKIVAPRAPETADPMLVVDANGKQVCWGVYNKVSMFCLRYNTDQVVMHQSCKLNHTMDNKVSGLPLTRRLYSPSRLDRITSHSLSPNSGSI